MTAAGFPHSGTSGSTPTCGSPKLFAAYRALLRLSMPRHPPCALISLDRISLSSPPTYLPHTWCSKSSPDDLVSPFSLPSTRIFNQSRFRECFNTDARPVRAFFATQGREAVRAPTRRSRKEVIQPQVPLRLPCYDFAPVTELAFGGSLPCGLGHRLRALPTSMA